MSGNRVDALNHGLTHADHAVLGEAYAGFGSRFIANACGVDRKDIRAGNSQNCGNVLHHSGGGIGLQLFQW